MERPGRHYFNQVIKFNITSGESCWHYVPHSIIWCILSRSRMRTFCSAEVFLKSSNPRLNMRNILDTVQLRDMSKSLIGYHQNCPGYKRQGKIEKLSQFKETRKTEMTKCNALSLIGSWEYKKHIVKKKWWCWNKTWSPVRNKVQMLIFYFDTGTIVMSVLLLGKTRSRVYGNSLFHLGNLSINMKVLQNKSHINHRRVILISLQNLFSMNFIFVYYEMIWIYIDEHNDF